MKRLMFFAVIILLPLACAELFAYYLTQAHDAVFAPDDRDIEAATDDKSYQDFLTNLYHAELGWQNPRAKTLTEVSCIGDEKVYSWDENGARYLQPDGGDVQVIAVGDSYTHGHEASNEETYPYQLQVHSGLKVANYGVNGFGPLQATLQFERAFEHHPTAKIAILGIMNKDIQRMPNSYRGIFFPSRNPYHFKPYIDVTGDEPQPRPNPNAPAAKSIEEVRARIKTALGNDYWSLPQPSFPYLWSTIQALQTKVFHFLVRTKLSRDKGKVEYSDAHLVEGMDYVAKLFIERVKAKGVQPVVAFIPENGFDLDTPAALVSRLRAEAPDSLILNVGEAGMDWSRYNLNGKACHPSPYGYDQIARYISAAILPLASPKDLAQSVPAPN